MTLVYFNMRKIAKNNLDSVLEGAQQIYEANMKINELEEKLEKYENTIMVTTNTTNTNTTVSSNPYIPEGMSTANPDGEPKIYASDIEFNRSPENVKIEVVKDSITNKSVDILITDNNEDFYGWGLEFRIQEKVNGNWKDLEYIIDESEVNWIEIAYNLDENNQLKQKIEWAKIYGDLKKGTYRVVKPVYDNEYIDLYSNEFEIKGSIILVGVQKSHHTRFF